MVKLAKGSHWIEVSFIALAISITALSGCGGGENNVATFSNASLNGVYYGSSFNISSSSTTTSSIEKATFDGNGHAMIEQIFGNASGANQTQTVNATYAVNADGTFTVTLGAEVSEGRLSADGNTSVGARVNSTEVQNFSVGMKSGASGFSNASLNGVYYSSSFNKNAQGITSSIEKATFFGNGTVNVEQVSYNESGVTQTQTILGATYAVNADGTFTLTHGTEVADGRLSADGNTTVSARINSMDVQDISIGIKGGVSGFSNASLNGVYYASSLSYDAVNHRYTSSIQKLTFDGGGNLTANLVYGSGIEINQVRDYVATYAVNSDGSFTVTQGGGVTQGRLSADSNTFVAANVIAPGFQSIITGVKN